MTMRLTQGQFSFLPDLTDEEITKQVRTDYERWLKLVDKANIRIE